MIQAVAEDLAQEGLSLLDSISAKDGASEIVRPLMRGGRVLAASLVAMGFTLAERGSVEGMTRRLLYVEDFEGSLSVIWFGEPEIEWMTAFAKAWGSHIIGEEEDKVSHAALVWDDAAGRCNLKPLPRIAGVNRCQLFCNADIFNLPKVAALIDAETGGAN